MIESGINGTLNRRLSKFIFRVATFLALIYIFLAIVEQWQEISEWRPDLFTVSTLVVLVGLYGASLFFLAEMWHRLTQAVSGKPLSRSLTLSSYSETQIAKYLPGNVFHLIGRHTFLSSNGLEHPLLARAFMLEVGFLICGAGIVASVGLLFSEGTIIGYSMTVLGVFGLAILALIAVFVFTILTRSAVPRYGIGLIEIALSSTFFLCQGLIFFTICRLISPTAEFFAVPSTALSWIAGYVVPGAPGGLGIREFVQLTLNNLGLRAPEALIAITLFRGVTILGDVMCFIIGRIFLK